MTMTTVQPADQERALQEFLEGLPEAARLPARTLAHAWQGGGGHLAVGRLAVRLTGQHNGGTFTAATIQAPRGKAPSRLEIARVLLQSHGVDEAAFNHWADELADLTTLGFDPAARFPALTLDGIDTAALARLATALRDLARLATA
jgi:hypothetical protein